MVIHEFCIYKNIYNFKIFQIAKLSSNAQLFRELCKLI